MLAKVKHSNRIGKLIDQTPGLTIYGLAKSLGMAYHNVKSIAESGEIPGGTQYKTLRSIADYFGVSIGDLEKTTSVAPNGQGSN